MASLTHTTAVGPDDEYYAYPDAVRWVVEGDIESYIREHGHRELPIPSIYQAFGSWPSYCGYVDGTLNQYGLGIDAEQLERAIWVLTGEEHYRYNADALTLIACESDPWILSGDQGTVLCEPEPVPRPSDPACRPTQDVETEHGILRIEEDNPAVLNGIKRMVALAGQTGMRVSRWRSGPFGSPFHTFELENGLLEATANELSVAGSCVTDPSKIPGWKQTREMNPPLSGEAIEVNWDGPEHAVGEETPYGVVVGYRFAWERQRASYAAHVETVAVDFDHRQSAESHRWVQMQVATREDRLGNAVVA